jgi:hypothetical protein
MTDPSNCPTMMLKVWIILQSKRPFGRGERRGIAVVPQGCASHTTWQCWDMLHWVDWHGLRGQDRSLIGEFSKLLRERQCPSSLAPTGIACAMSELALVRTYPNEGPQRAGPCRASSGYDEMDNDNRRTRRARTGVGRAFSAPAS